MNREELDKHRRMLIELNKELQQENKQLKERFERLVQEHIDTITRNEEKQQRIDKAIEFNQKIYDTTEDNTKLMAKINLEILGDNYENIKY